MALVYVRKEKKEDAQKKETKNNKCQDSVSMYTSGTEPRPRAGTSMDYEMDGVGRGEVGNMQCSAGKLSLERFEVRQGKVGKARY
jgi:hypothetical protein